MKLLTTRKIDRIWRKIRVKVRRKYKDQLFQRVFSDKKDLLDLYNAVNNTSSEPKFGKERYAGGCNQ